MPLAHEEARGLQVGVNQIKEERNDVEPTEVLFSCGVSVCVFVRGGRSEPALEANGSLPRRDLGIVPRDPRSQPLGWSRSEPASRTKTRNRGRANPDLQEIL